PGDRRGASPRSTAGAEGTARARTAGRSSPWPAVSPAMAPTTVRTDYLDRLLAVLGDRLFGAAPSFEKHKGDVLFSLHTDGSHFKILRQFPHSRSYPGLTEMAVLEGVLYGAVTFGGDSGKGFVFAINPDGSDYRMLHDF